MAKRGVLTLHLLQNVFAVYTQSKSLLPHTIFSIRLPYCNVNTFYISVMLGLLATVLCFLCCGFFYNLSSGLVAF